MKRTSTYYSRPQSLGDICNNKTSNNWNRFEQKYLISELQAISIRNYFSSFMELDENNRHTTNHHYLINSYYLDSPDLRLYRESLDGQKNRFKLRLRNYSDSQESGDFFEIKRRINTTIVKSRARVASHQTADILNGSLRPPEDHSQDANTIEQFLLYKANLNARPVIGVQYHRQAFESPINERVRITFDRHLSYCPLGGNDFSKSPEDWQLVELNNSVILEIKYTGYFPAWISRMVRHFNLKAQSVSKYAVCMKQASLLPYHGPHYKYSQE